MKSIRLTDCDIVTCYDPARSRESEFGRSARNAIVTTACSQDYEVFVLTYWAMRCPFDLVYDELWRQVDQFHPRCIGIEDVATQMTIGGAFEKLAQTESRHLPPIEPLRPDTRVNKKWRIRTQLQQVAPYGKLHILPNSYELESEWSAFPNGRTIDIIDTLAYCIQLHSIPFEEDAENSYNARMRRAHAHAKGSYEEEENVYDINRYRVPRPPDNLVDIRELFRGRALVNS